MAIISVEELIKTLIVFLDGNGFEFRNVKGMDIVFNHHEIRYLIAYAMFVMSLFGEELFKFLVKVREDPNELIKMNEAIKRNLEEFFERTLNAIYLENSSRLKESLNGFPRLTFLGKMVFTAIMKNNLRTQ